MMSQENAIFVDNVTVRRNTAVVLRDVTIGVPSRAVTVVLGRSGAGKTTLLYAMLGLLPLESGQIVVGEGSLQEPSILSRHRRETAVVFQNHALIERLTAIENVQLGLVELRSPFDPRPWPTAIRIAAARALREVEMLPFAHQRVSRLSGGQRQRVGIARALVRAPKLLIADEPFSSLDPLLTRSLCKLIRNQVSRLGTSVLMVLHQIDVAVEVADWIIGMANGRVVFSGPPSLFLGHPLRSLFPTTVSLTGKDVP